MNMAVQKENFNDLVNDEAKTTSLIIAEKFGKQHKDVLRAIRNLECSKEFSQRNFAQTPYVEHQNGQTYQMYEITRDGFAFLVMGFTGKAAAEWKERFIAAFNEMERRLGADGGFSIPKTMGEALQLAADQFKRIEEMREDVEALDRLAAADGSLSITEVAKNLGVRPKDAFGWLSQNGWIYKRPGGSAWLGYQSKCNAGLLEHKSTTVLRADGTERVTEQVRVTAKGLTTLAKLVPGVAREAF